MLSRSPLAALTGMLLDQQVPMEWAFTGPYTIAQRMGADDLDAHAIAARDPEQFAALLSQKPAVHRYPGSMAKRVQQLCQYLVDHYDGDASAVWRDVPTGAEVLKRLNALPGYGKQKGPARPPWPALGATDRPSFPASRPGLGPMAAAELRRSFDSEA
ncbi:hypothetical protein GCM10012287_10010 [Streptomyces daqingensis]|uniref:HhH-GPD domain-containing protein n=1 Tax=Streptomyces daqingensis TaxID=1472640 RepID=A0ABQ2LXQ0_9ACTN|nr:hypothetical protein GCM10012287_10010 [Streptomyces daqingensis]